MTMSDPSLHTALTSTPAWQAASYHAQELPEFAGNPLIEALPPISSDDELMCKLAYDPGWSPADRALPAHLRLHKVAIAKEFFEPLPHVVDLAHRISMLIRPSYRQRDPRAPGFWREVERGLAAIQQNLPFPPDTAPTARGMGLFGMSGVGKTKAVEKILALYPQVILHSCYQGQEFSWQQVVWLKLDCPPDASLKGLCFAFFVALDRLLDTSYWAHYARNGRATKDEMMVHMARLCAIHSIGLLVIDELQCLCESSGEHPRVMLNFFVRLVNEMHVPVMTIGTYMAEKLFTENLRQARRVIGDGCPPWDRTRKGGVWDLFLRALSRYQYTPVPFTLVGAHDGNRTLGDVLYDETQGITDFVQTVYFHAQILAIRDEGEEGCPQTVTVDTLRAAGQVALRPVAKLITALRHNNVTVLATMQDVHPLDLQAEIRAQALAQQARDQQRTSRQQKSRRTTDANGSAAAGARPEQDTEKSPLLDLHHPHHPERAKQHGKQRQQVQDLPLDVADAPDGDHSEDTKHRQEPSRRTRSRVTRAPASTGTSDTSNDSDTSAMQHASTPTKPPKPTKARTSARASSDPKTTTHHVKQQQAATDATDGYDALVQRGLVRNADEFLTEGKVR